MSVHQPCSHESQKPVTGVLKIVNQRLVLRVLGVAGVTDVVVPGRHRPVGCALTPGAAVHDRSEEPAGVRVEGASLSWSQADLPCAQAIVLEPEPLADLETACCGVHLVLVVGTVKSAFAVDRGGHAASLRSLTNHTGVALDNH
jgi:hypothetical protein